MARLEHENIVQVFSEASLDNGTRLLCMQYVPGPTLQDVLGLAGRAPVEEWSGQMLLETVDRLTVRSGRVRSEFGSQPRIAGQLRLGRNRLLDRPPIG